MSRRRESAKRWLGVGLAVLGIAALCLVATPFVAVGGVMILGAATAAKCLVGATVAVALARLQRF